MRKRLTERFPFLIPIRQFQRKLFFYIGKRFDSNTYSHRILSEELAFQAASYESPLISEDTGFPIIYQMNKVFNLKLAAKCVDGLIIKPGESMSLCLRLKNADKEIRYKDALVDINGKLTTGYGGGLCQLSNVLHYLFLHTDLTVVERKGHGFKDFKETGDFPLGVDATLAEGFIDLAVRNDTSYTYQIIISFTDKSIIGKILMDEDLPYFYQISNGELSYFRENNKVYENVEVRRFRKEKKTFLKLKEEILYTNVCSIGYSIPEHLITKNYI